MSAVYVGGGGGKCGPAREFFIATKTAMATYLHGGTFQNFVLLTSLLPLKASLAVPKLVNSGV